MEAIEMQYVRRINGGSGRDRIRFDITTSELGIKPYL